MHEINRPDVVAEVRTVFERYEAALLTNDVAVLEELFWNALETTRYGMGENLYGWEAISRFRRARTTGPFSRRLMNTVITTYGEDFRDRQHGISARRPRTPGTRDEDAPAYTTGLAHRLRPRQPHRRDRLKRRTRVRARPGPGPYHPCFSTFSTSCRSSTWAQRAQSLGGGSAP